MNTPLENVDGVWVKRESVLPAGYKTRGTERLAPGPHLVVSCGNWSAAVLSARPGSVALQSEDYTFVASRADAVADLFRLPIATFDPSSAAGLFLEIRDELGRWPDAFAFASSGGSLVLAGSLVVPDTVKLVGACTDSTPNFFNIVHGQRLPEAARSAVPSLYTTAGFGIPRYRYPWWTDEHTRRSTVAMIAESRLEGPPGLTPYGRLAWHAAELEAGLVVAVETG